MISQTMPDQFYYQIIGFGVLVGMIAARVWQLAFMMAGRYDSHSQRFRYKAIVGGFMPSIVLIAYLAWHWGVNPTINGLNEMYQASHGYGTALWAMIVVHLMAFVGLPAFAVWYYYHPSKYSGYDR